MRDLYIIGGMVAVAAVVGGILFLFGPSGFQSDVNSALTASASSESTSTVSFTVLEQGSNAISVTDRTNYRITSQDELEILWPMVYASNTVQPLPTIDFTKYEVLAVFDGSHATGGYAVQVSSVQDANAVRTVSIMHTTPPSSCRVSQAQSSPFIIIQVPKTDFSLAHIDQSGTGVCQ